MRKVGFVLVCCLALFLSSCGSSQYKDSIVGKWQSTTTPAVMELTKDGKVNAGPMSGTYTLDSSDNLRVTTNKPVKGNTRFQSKVEIKNDMMTLTDPDGTKTTWKRVK
jgi:hypothetical protein